MKATIKNINKVFNLLTEWHIDNQAGADFAQFDDESDLEDAVKSIIEQLKEARRSLK